MTDPVSVSGPDIETLLAAHLIVFENDGGDYGGRSWLECSCDAGDVLNPTEYATEAQHRAHVAAVLRAHIATALEDARFTGKADTMESVLDPKGPIWNRMHADGWDEGL